MSDLADDPHALAKKLGKVVVLPKKNELFIDVDDDGTALEVACAVAASIGLGLIVTRKVASKTPGHFHVYIEAPRELTPVLRIALQACLGSDRKRELLSLARILFRVPRDPTLFFEDKE